MDQQLMSDILTLHYASYKTGKRAKRAQFYNRNKARRRLEKECYLSRAAAYELFKAENPLRPQPVPVKVIADLPIPVVLYQRP